ncbi:MAG TPA: D-alanyl-D-alanine carboxypeptidase/D-alanyl-D-alanine-endopeptidase [Candidatus Acidoferrum sp.]|nr:D-alanyl-D-alanine carboxypeptidase/D-alanyl-D-alanine-endopeptidase [Candidatus Acidoferrum sp.]
MDTGVAGQGEWGAEVMDADSGEILYQRNADKYFVPASNMKLLTTALALAKLGPDYRFRTTVETRGVLSADGVLSSDVVLVGRGDPNLSNRKFPFQGKEEFDGPPERVLSELADAVVAHGVKSISGDVVGDDSYFPAERYPSGWEIDDMVWEYGAAISAIVTNDNTVKVTLTPGAAAGDEVRAEAWPTTPDFVVENRVVTSGPDAKPDLRLTRDPGAKVVVIAGTIPARSVPRSLVLAIEEPALHAAALLKKLLEDRGVAISGVARAVHEAVDLPDAPLVLAEHKSVPLGDSVKLVNKISQNLHTEMYLRTAARQSGVWKTPEELQQSPQNFYEQAGITAGDVVQTDGSGLSRHDLVTPRALVAVLRFAQQQPWFRAYYDSLPIAGVDGTLEDRMKNTAAAGRVHAKSGSLEHVRTRSGYVETASGRQLIFAFLGNNQAGKGHEATEVLDGLCVAMAEEWAAAVPASATKQPAHH